MQKIFILVWVHRGFIREPELFYSVQEAEIRRREIKKAGFNPDYDEVEVFEKPMLVNTPIH